MELKQVFVQTLGGSPNLINAPGASVKNYIQMIAGIPTNQQKAIEVSPQWLVIEEQSMEIYVRLPSGDTIKVDAAATGNIDQLRKKTSRLSRSWT